MRKEQPPSGGITAKRAPAGEEMTDPHDGIHDVIT